MKRKIRTFGLINIRKLAALDVSLNGWMPITAEFFFGVFGLMMLGILFFDTIIGVYLLLASFNYVPLLVYALQIGNQRNAKKEARIELSKLKKYGPKGIRNYNLQQLICFVPLSIVIISILQEFLKKYRKR